MDFTLDAEQVLLRDSVARFAADRATDVRRDRWQEFAGLGWLAIGSPQELGGFGGSIETLLFMEQCGYGLLGTAYVAQAVLAGTILREAKRYDLLEELVEGRRRFTVAYEESGARYDPACVQTTALPSGDGWNLHGTKTRVLDASTAAEIIVSTQMNGKIALVAVPADAAGLTRTTYRGEDGSDVADVRFDGVRVDRSALILPDGLGLLEKGIDHATAALCAEALGLCRHMLETTVAYTKQRHQFGVPLSSFQALQHRMADMYVELELLRSMAYLAAMTLQDESDPATRKRGISAAKALVAKSGRFIGQQAIQLHGGIGMSEEYKIGHYFKRMTMVERLFGDRDYHLRRYIESSRQR
jgi:alkylation response protein AidB-like acyl-CoA dehydrogenase